MLNIIYYIFYIIYPLGLGFFWTGRFFFGTGLEKCPASQTPWLAYFDGGRALAAARMASGWRALSWWGGLLLLCGRFLVAGWRAAGWRGGSCCCVEGFWLKWFVIMGRALAAEVGRVSGCCVEGFWLMWFAVMGTPLLLRGGFLAAVWGSSGRRGLSFLLLSGRFLLGVWGASGWCVEGFWPMWFVVMGRVPAALWSVSGLGTVWKVSGCCVEGLSSWALLSGGFVAAAWRASGRRGLSSLLLSGGFLVGVWRASGWCSLSSWVGFVLLCGGFLVFAAVWRASG